MVKDRVESGVYGSASEVVREALRRFFHVSEDNNIHPEDIEHIRQVVGPRLEAVKNGTATLKDGEAVFDETDDMLVE
ncbi:MAG: type II toxin-antitoxin system ParD family antitoxin [Candidatus Scalindua rubra]|nr:type II toxin-antitoxin system ParD family antitoxin [Candidatus Scalindua rubra]